MNFMCFVFGLCLFVFYVHFCFVYRFASLADRRRLLLQSHKEHASFQSDFSAKSTVSRCVHKFYLLSISMYHVSMSTMQCYQCGWLSFPFLHSPMCWKGHRSYLDILFPYLRICIILYTFLFISEFYSNVYLYLQRICDVSN